MSTAVHNMATALAFIAIGTLRAGYPAFLLGTACDPAPERSDWSDRLCEVVLDADPVDEMFPISEGMGLTWVACVPPTFPSNDERSCDDVQVFQIQPYQLSASLGFTCWTAGDYYPDGDACLNAAQHASISGWVWCDPW